MMEWLTFLTRSLNSAAVSDSNFSIGSSIVTSYTVYKEKNVQSKSCNQLLPIVFCEKRIRLSVQQKKNCKWKTNLKLARCFQDPTTIRKSLHFHRCIDFQIQELFFDKGHEIESHIVSTLWAGSGMLFFDRVSELGNISRTTIDTLPSLTNRIVNSCNLQNEKKKVVE